jgi:hypothetical protein
VDDDIEVEELSVVAQLNDRVIREGMNDKRRRRGFLAKGYDSVERGY